MYIELGNKVKKLRLKNKVTQQELANALKVSRVQISNIENGRRGMNLKQLNTLCNFFRIDLSYFVSEDIPNTGEKLIEQANAIFNNDNITNDIKDSIFEYILNIYMNSKENK